MTNDIENIDTEANEEAAVRKATILIAYAMGVVVGGSTVIVCQKVNKKFRDRKAEKNAEDEN